MKYFHVIYELSRMLSRSYYIQNWKINTWLPYTEKIMSQVVCECRSHQNNDNFKNILEIITHSKSERKVIIILNNCLTIDTKKYSNRCEVNGVRDWNENLHSIWKISFIFEFHRNIKRNLWLNRLKGWQPSLYYSMIPRVFYLRSNLNEILVLIAEYVINHFRNESLSIQMTKRNERQKIV